MSDECEHGRLRRQCPICERDERIAELERRIEIVEREASRKAIPAKRRIRELEAALRKQRDRWLQRSHELSDVGKNDSEEIEAWSECCEALSAAPAGESESGRDGDEVAKLGEDARMDAWLISRGSIPHWSSSTYTETNRKKDPDSGEDEALKLCPFCGDPQMRVLEAESMGDDGEDWVRAYVHCWKCGGTCGFVFDDEKTAKAKAARRWNSRALRQRTVPDALRAIPNELKCYMEACSRANKDEQAHAFATAIDVVQRAIRCHDEQEGE